MTKVLLVEDDINLREIYAARLSAEGYDLVTASDGEEALSKAVAEKPDLIVLDVMMPKISGFDVLDILRSTPETKSTQVIMLSALSQESDRERGEKLGANKYLVKSQITLEDVVSTVKGMLAEANGETPAIVANADGRLPSDGDTPKNPEDEPTEATPQVKPEATQGQPVQPPAQETPPTSSENTPATDNNNQL